MWGLPARLRRDPQAVASVPVPAGVAVLPAARPAMPDSGAAAAVVVEPGRSAAGLRDGVYVAGVAGGPGCAAAAEVEQGPVPTAEVAQGSVPTAADDGDAGPGG